MAVQLNINVSQGPPLLGGGHGPPPGPIPLQGQVVPPSSVPPHLRNVGGGQGGGGPPIPPGHTPFSGGPGGGGQVPPLISRFESSVVVLTALFGSLIRTVKALDSSFMQMAKEGSQYNAQIGIAVGMAELRDTLAQIRRANRLQNELSGYTQARSGLDVSVQGLTDTISAKLIPLLERGTNSATATTKAIDDVLKKVPNPGEVTASIKQAVEDALKKSGLSPEFARGVTTAIDIWMGGLKVEDDIDAKALSDFAAAINPFLFGFEATRISKERDKKEKTPHKGLISPPGKR